MKRLALCCCFFLLTSQAAWAALAKISAISRDPYVSAMVLDAESGKTLVAENIDTPVYPASVLKLMDLLVILDRIDQGVLKLDDMVQVTKEAYKTGGSQVYLDPKEQFSVEELLYALMVQSANDAAVALATHVAGSKEGFVALMNQKAQQLGMKNTTFHSVHGLPPSEGQSIDVTTARDLSILCLELAKRPETYKYTGITTRDFRQGEFIMRNHNKLLGDVDGCDGFKTGYIQAAGFSIAATAKRGGVRIIAIVMGSKDRKVRDAKAKEMLAKGFGLVPPKPEALAAVPVVPAQQQPPAARQPETPASLAQPEAAVPAEAMPPAATLVEEEPKAQASGGGWGRFFIGLAVGFVAFLSLFSIIAFYFMKKRNRKNTRYSRRS